MLRQSQISLIVQHRKAFYAARDRGDNLAKASAANAWTRAINNATTEENDAATRQWQSQPHCRLCTAHNVTVVTRWGRYCSDLCASIHREWLNRDR